MVRCRCGVWTDFGLTCSKCRMEGLTDEQVEESDELEEETILEEPIEEDD